MKSDCLGDQNGKADSSMSTAEKGYPGEIRDMDGQCQDFIQDTDAYVKSYSDLPVLLKLASTTVLAMVFATDSDAIA